MLLCDTSTGLAWPVVPATCRRRILMLITVSHTPSVRVTRKLITKRLVWPAVSSDVAEWTRCCRDCQSSKIHRRVQASLHEFPLPPRRFHYVHIYVVSPLPPSEGFTHFHTVIDRFFRWPEAIPLRDTRLRFSAHLNLTVWRSGRHHF